MAPIRLDLEIDGYRIKDTFTWNIYETACTPDLFADTLCDDFDVPKPLFKQPIAASIKEQISDFKTYGIPECNEHEDLRVPIKVRMLITAA